jgi:hypothetical protein
MNPSKASTDTRHNTSPQVGAPTRPALSRTKVVWGALALSMTCVGGLLMLSDATPRPAQALPVAAERAERSTGLDALFQTSAPLDAERWTGIVIHHSGEPSGSAASIGDDHQARGLRGLGYHFVIGNGRGAGDGAIHAGYRWDAQLPGAHVTGPDADAHNRRTIGICLVGDGDAKAFSERQLASLIALVDRLREECGLDVDDVHLHTDLAPTASPGRLFPAAAFRAMLRTRG